MSNYRLLIDREVLQRYPAYACVVVYIDGINNTGPTENSAELLRQAERKAKTRLDGGSPAMHPHIGAWRSAYQGFGAKPKKYLCSVEALLTRVLKGEPLPSITPVVDVYNAVSLEHLMPVGGEDRDKLTSTLVLAVAEGTEPFDTRRSGEIIIEHPDPGEIVWKDSSGVTCRRWNWRQCSRTAVLPETQRGYFVFDCLPPFGVDEGRLAAQQFIDRVKEFSPGASAETEVLYAPALSRL